MFRIPRSSFARSSFARSSFARSSLACVLALVAACARSTNEGLGDGHASVPTRLSATLDASASPGASSRVPEENRAASQAAAAVDAATAGSETATVCLSDAGARHGALVVRFVVRPDDVRVAGADDRGTALDLEIPARGVRRHLCTAGCPYRFVNRKETPSRATFECEQDLWPTEGTVSIVDDVVIIDTATALPRRVKLPAPSVRHQDDAAPIPPPVPPTREVIALPCGAPIVLQTSPPSQCPTEAELSL